MDSLNTPTLAAIIVVAVLLVAFVAWLTGAISRLEADEQRTLVGAIELVKRLGES